MKKTALYSLALFAGVNFLSSCGRSGYFTTNNHLRNNVTGVDTEGFRFFKTTYEKASHGAELAKFVGSLNTSASVKELAGQIASTYDSILPTVYSLAEKNHVLLPDPGMPAFEVPAAIGGKDSVAFNEAAYLKEALKTQEELTEQFEVVSENTLPGLNAYARLQLPKMEKLKEELAK
ncbi:hypothetical protein SAMN05216436_12726 [bacterium A37T11]|nr:hypothetical protein SAMN05216436_12726 [bacterium A37T11]